MCADSTGNARYLVIIREGCRGDHQPMKVNKTPLRNTDIQPLDNPQMNGRVWYRETFIRVSNEDDADSTDETHVSPLIADQNALCCTTACTVLYCPVLYAHRLKNAREPLG